MNVSSKSTPATDPSLPHVVIVGAGFGGLEAAKRLRKERVNITIVDRRNHHLFQPLLYQVATAGLSPSNIAVPIRSLFRKDPNVRVILAEVESIVPEKRQLLLKNTASLDYDYLILAAGAKTSYFGRDEWSTLAPGLKSLEDAIEIRKRVLSAFERAEQCDDPKLRQQLLTFVIIGGGPSGVEMAGAIAEMASKTMAKDFRNFTPSSARVILAEGADRLLGGFHPSLSDYARQALEKRSVDVRLRTFATAIDQHSVQLGEETVQSGSIIWVAGVSASPLGRNLGLELDRMGRVPVNDDLTVPDHPEIQVIGDMAHFKAKDGSPLPGVSPVAIRQGKHAAGNIRRALQGQTPKNFTYFNKGTMATIGRNAAVADLRGLRCRGFLAWLAWLFLHVMYLVGFRNRVITFFEWAYAYATYSKGSRLITWTISTEAFAADKDNDLEKSS